MDSSASSQAGTVSIPFIFLKPRGKTSARPKKAQFPSSFSGLMKVCQRLFQSYGEVKSIWTTDGVLIQSLNDVIPGSTLLVSSMEPGMQPMDALKPLSLMKPPRIDPVFSSDSYNRLFGSSQASISDLNGATLNVGGGKVWDDDEATMSEDEPFGSKKGSPPDRKKFVSERKTSPPQDKKKSTPTSAKRRLSGRDDSPPSSAKESAPGSSKRRLSGRDSDAAKELKGADKRRLSGRDDSPPSSAMASTKGGLSQEDSPPSAAKESASQRRLSSQDDSPPSAVKAKMTLIRKKESPVKSIATPTSVNEDNASPKRRKRRTKHRDESPSQEEPVQEEEQEEITSTPQESPKEEHTRRRRRSRKNQQSPSANLEEGSANQSPVTKKMASPGSAKGKSSAILSPSGARGMGLRRADDFSSSETDSPPRQFGSTRSDRAARSPRGDDSGSFTADSLMNLITETIGEDSITDIAQDSFADSEYDVKELLAAAPECERQQEQNWFLRGHQLFAAQAMAVTDSDIYGYDQISEHVKNIMSKHRFVYPGGVGYKIQAAIFGPRQCGKSHFLSVFADEIMLEFAMNGHWKKTFFMFMNFRLMTPFLSNVAVFYGNMVEQTLNSLVWQRPILQPWLSKMRNFFLSLPDSKSCPRIPINSKFYQENPHFAPAVQRIMDRLWDIWTDPEALGPWLTITFLFPSLISQAAGFTSIFYFIDNMEFADIDLNGPYPFAETEQSCYVVEFLKFALQRGNFVVTSENQERLEEILAPTEAGGTDLFHDLEIVTPFNLIKDEDDRSIKIDIQGELAPFQLTIDHCCGIPAYVGLWKELNLAFDRNADGVDDDEYQVLLMTHAQHVLDVIFVIPDSEDALFVTGARR